MHFHDWQQLDHYSDVPTRNRARRNGRTSFLVLACVCGLATVFPVENYLDAEPVFQARLVENLARAGLTLDTSS